MEAKVTSKRDKEKLVTLQDINDMDQTTTIKLNGSKGDFKKRQGETGDFARYQWYGSDNNNQSTGSFTVGETKGCVHIVEKNNGVTNAMNILTCKAENLKQKVSTSFVWERDIC